jgi:hypothetical protein
VVRYLMLTMCLVAVVAACACLGGGSGVPPPVAEDVYLEVDPEAAVSLDGLQLEPGAQELMLLANWPNYLAVDGWKLIVWQCAGLDTLALLGTSNTVQVPSVSPADVVRLE